jgi:hypothetical protein
MPNKYQPSSVTTNAKNWLVVSWPVRVACQCVSYVLVELYDCFRQVVHLLADDCWVNG